LHCDVLHRLLLLEWATLLLLLLHGHHLRMPGLRQDLSGRPAGLDYARLRVDRLRDELRRLHCYVLHRLLLLECATLVLLLTLLLLLLLHGHHLRLPGLYENLSRRPAGLARDHARLRKHRLRDELSLHRLQLRIDLWPAGLRVDAQRLHRLRDELSLLRILLMDRFVRWVSIN